MFLRATGQRIEDLEPTWPLSMQQAQVQLIVCDFAIQCYHLDAGEYPRSLSNLVPTYLPAILNDPFADKPLTYRMTPTSYLLYSLGPDGRDDDGRMYTLGNDTYQDGKTGFYPLPDGDILLREPFARIRNPDDP